MESVERGVSEVSERETQHEAQIQADERKAMMCGSYPGC